MSRRFEVFSTRQDEVGRVFPNVKIAEYAERDDGKVDFRFVRWDYWIRHITLESDFVSELEQHRRLGRIVLEQPA